MYQQLMDAFIQDDHDHSVCAVSESVQLYTVPTLVRAHAYMRQDVLCVRVCVALSDSNE